MKKCLRIGFIITLLLASREPGKAQSSIINTYAGPPLPVNGTSAVTQTVDLVSSAVSDGAGGFYVASMQQNRVYRVAADGTMALVIGGLASPQGLAVDAAGNLFISDTNHNRVLKVTATGEIRTIAGTGGVGYGGDGGAATSALLYGPMGLAIDSAGNLFVAENGNGRVRKITPGGFISTVAGNGASGSGGDGGPATDAQLGGVCAVALDTTGNLFISSLAGRIRKVAQQGLISVITTIAGSDSSGYQGDGGPATSAYFNGPCGLTVDASGNVFVADSFNNRIRKISAAGIITSVAGDGTFDYGGDGGPAVSAKLNRPNSVSLDVSGNLFVADTYNHRVRRFKPGNTIVTVAGNGRDGFAGDGSNAAGAHFNSPTGIAVDSSGNIFIADRDNNRIRKVTTGGIVSTIAGNGTAGFSGDGGAATAARLNGPEAVAVDGAGNVFISDSLNQRVRKVTPGGIISSITGNGTPDFAGDGGLATSAH